MSDTPTIPHGYRLVSGPHTASEVEEGWTICAAITDWDPYTDTSRDSEALRCSWRDRRMILSWLDDPERDIYRIEKVSP